MPKTDPAYERPFWVSLALVVCSSLAVIVMAGWLAMMIMESKGGGTADPADAAALDAASPPRVENAEPAYIPPMSASAIMRNPAADGAAASDAPATSAPALPGAAAGPRLALGGAATSAVATAQTSFSGPGDLLSLDPPKTADAALETVPLPPPRPRRTAAVPVPRSRPPIDNADAPAPRGWSLFDLFVDRQH